MFKRTPVAILTVILLMVFCFPAAAAVNLVSNGSSTGQSLEIVDDRAMVALPVIARITGADASVDAGQNISIIKNGATLKMKVGDAAADLNGEALSAPVAPQVVNGTVMAPLGFVCQSFNIDVSWDAQNQSVNLIYSEKRDGMTPEEVLAKCLTAVQAKNSCKIKGDVQVTMDMSGSSIPGSSTPPPAATAITENIIGAVSQKPLLADISMDVTVPGTPSAGIQTMEMYLNDQAMFMKMPDGVWVKMDVPGFDYKALLDLQNKYQDTQFALEQMKKYGINLVFNNDQNNCRVISASISPDAFRQIYQSMQSLISPSLFPGSAGNDQSLQQMMNTMSQNMQANMVMRMFVDKDSFLLTAMDADLFMNLSMPVPANDSGSAAGQLNMQMKENINYTVSDYGATVSAPDVSKAISFSDYVKNLTANTQK